MCDIECCKRHCKQGIECSWIPLLAWNSYIQSHAYVTCIFMVLWHFYRKEIKTTHLFVFLKLRGMTWILILCLEIWRGTYKFVLHLDYFVVYIEILCGALSYMILLSRVWYLEVYYSTINSCVVKCYVVPSNLLWYLKYLEVLHSTLKFCVVPWCIVWYLEVSCGALKSCVVPWSLAWYLKVSCDTLKSRAIPCVVP